MMVRQRRKFRELPINSLIPNMITVLALCAGLTGVKFAIEEKWELSVVAILVAGVLDGLDGRMARLLKGSTKFGAELDSLSDFISFGVAPALIVFFWSLHQGMPDFGWIIALVFSVACALRLARFNTALEAEDKPKWEERFFTGIAAPGGASISLLFMVCHFATGADIFRSAWLNGFWLLFMGFLMASRVPTFSIKKIRINRRYIMPILMLVGAAAAVLVTFPWPMLIGVALLYLSTIPLAILSYRRFSRMEEEAEIAASDGTASDEGSAEDIQTAPSSETAPEGETRSKGQSSKSIH